MKASEQTVKDRTHTSLIDAITQDQFMLYGQPIVPLSARSDRSAYIEVLIRYVEEEKNHLPPGGFFDVLEDLHLMAVLDRWVINRVFRSMLGQHAAQERRDVPRYSVNLSADSLREEEFARLVLAYARKNDLPAGKLWFEVSEADADAHADALRTFMGVVVPAGCGVTLTSYTGRLLPVPSLRRLGFDSVKISSEGVCDLDLNYTLGNAQSVQLACARQNIRTIAEMVEAPEALEAVKQLGFDYAQGYAIAPPVPLQSLAPAAT